MSQSAGAPSQSPARIGAIDRYFKISERGSTVAREVRGGLVSFFAMAYIIVLNPLILGSGVDVEGNQLSIIEIAAVTAFTAGVMTVAFGAIARYPFAFATGLGINSLVAVTIARQVTWAEAMGLIVIEGIIIVILAVSGFRKAVFDAIPSDLKAAIAVGIGLFIAMVGFVDSGFVRRLPDAAGTTVPVGLGIEGSIASWPTAVFAFGLLLCGVLVARQVRGGIFIGIVVTTVVAIIVEAIANAGPSFVDGEPSPTGWNLAVPGIPETLGGLPNLSLIGQVDLFGAFVRIGPLAASLFVFTLLLANFFDAMGTFTGLGKEAGLMDENGNLPNMKTALVVEGVGAVAGGFTSSSSNTVFLESATGIAEGARTGLANIVTGVLFLIAMFFTPLYEVVPVEAAAPALVVVGALMMSQIVQIDFTRFSIALPAFLTIVTMPFTYSIANGIGIGFVAWVVMATATGKARSVHPLLWVVAVAFLVFFAIGPITDLLA
ncbi:NCS2 family permease [Dietzia psychralcaliphila]|uniref:MFS transporter n=1 Tax=Dietzia psychralcaliphila TaxID=139021 RepID=A0AAD0NPC6_9ACTN|nr:NCS2 family permease [Dietzia psychralcaliphila]AWH94799.1 MFS transporter [Dietzia psychralcaliphila]PTM86916.1 AGZA family xanthine/uracil permease-like MFS transporter [Dietzia psychralcaliphila]